MRFRCAKTTSLHRVICAVVLMLAVSACSAPASEPSMSLWTQQGYQKAWQELRDASKLERVAYVRIGKHRMQLVDDLGSAWEWQDGAVFGPDVVPDDALRDGTIVQAPEALTIPDIEAIPDVQLFLEPPASSPGDGRGTPEHPEPQEQFDLVVAAWPGLGPTVHREMCQADQQGCRALHALLARLDGTRVPRVQAQPAAVDALLSTLPRDRIWSVQVSEDFAEFQWTLGSDRNPVNFLSHEHGLSFVTGYSSLIRHSGGLIQAPVMKGLTAARLRDAARLARKHPKFQTLVELASDDHQTVYCTVDGDVPAGQVRVQVGSQPGSALLCSRESCTVSYQA